MNEVGSNVRGHGRVIINAATARGLGIAAGDWVEVSSTTGVTRGLAELVQGCRPDTIVIPGQFEHWKTPYAKDLHFPSLNAVSQLTGALLDLTDSSGSGADIVRVRVRRVSGPLAQGTHAWRLHDGPADEGDAA